MYIGPLGEGNRRFPLYYWHAGETVPRSNLIMKVMSDFAQALTAMAVGTAIGFLSVGAGARALDAWGESQCPGVNRVLVNRSPWLKDWTAYGACPRQGLTAPLKP